MPVSAWFFAIGSAAVFLIGGLGNFTLDDQDKNAAKAAQPVADNSLTPDAPATFTPGMAEIARLAQAHVPAAVVLDYIRNQRQAYSPTAEELLYLSSLGMSQEVLAALIPAKSSSPPNEMPVIARVTPVEPVVPAPPDVNAFQIDPLPSRPIIVESEPPPAPETEVVDVQPSCPDWSGYWGPPVELVVALPPLRYAVTASAVQPKQKGVTPILTLPTTPAPPVRRPLRPQRDRTEFRMAQATTQPARHSYFENMVPVSTSRASERAR